MKKLKNDDNGLIGILIGLGIVAVFILILLGFAGQVCTLAFFIIFIVILLVIAGLPLIPGRARLILIVFAVIVFIIALFTVMSA